MSPNCRSRSTSTTFESRWASATERFVATSVLPVPPFGPRMAISGAVGFPGMAIPLRRAITFRSVNATSSGRLRESDHVVCAGFERLPQEAVRRATRS